MKNILLVTILILFNLVTKSQDSNFKKHEIGLNLYSYNRIYQKSYAPQYSTTFDFGDPGVFLNGLWYRYHFKKSALRVALTYQYKNYENSNEDGIIEAGEYLWGEIWNVEVKIGYERSFGSKKIKPILGIDLLYRYGFNDAYYYSCYDPLCSPMPPPILSINMLGIAPSVGVSYQFTRRFSMRIQSNIIYGGQQIEETSRLIVGQKTMNDVSNIFIVNPISEFSLNFNF